jgi:hypothetical protein
MAVAMGRVERVKVAQGMGGRGRVGVVRVGMERVEGGWVVARRTCRSCLYGQGG